MGKRTFLLGGIVAGTIITLGDLALVAGYLGERIVTAGAPAQPTAALFLFHITIKAALGFALFAAYLLARESASVPLPPAATATLIGWTMLYPSATALLHNLGALDVMGLIIMAAWGAAEMYLAVTLAALATRGRRQAIS